jgi:hypothetical protein
MLRPRSDGSSSTRFELGARGSLGDSAFSLVGRTRVRGPRGVTWNEWTLRFDDGRSCFLAESIDALTLYTETSILPSFDTLVPGAPLDTGFVVVERGRATRTSQWGEVEEAPRSYAFVDLSSRSGAPATIDFGGDGLQAGPSPPFPHVFVGRPVTIAELGLSAAGSALGLLITAPEVSRPKGVELWLSVGDTGVLDSARAPVRVLGSVSRSMAVPDDETVRWDEYLLVDEPLGATAAALRWLVLCDGHFNLVEEIEPGLVVRGGSTDAVAFDGNTYEKISEGTARVDWASGQLPWEIAIGDTSHVQDFVHAPHILTEERTGERDVVTWSRGVYVASDAIAKAFGKRTLPRPLGRPPNAPTIK